MCRRCDRRRQRLDRAPVTGPTSRAGGGPGCSSTAERSVRMTASKPVLPVLYTVAEVADLLKVSIKTLRRWIDADDRA